VFILAECRQPRNTLGPPASKPSLTTNRAYYVERTRLAV